MYTLCIRYTLDPNRMAHFRAYVAAELPVLRRSGGAVDGYGPPTDYAGPSDTAYGLITSDSLAAYETYRHALAADAAHRVNAEALERSAAVLRVERSFLHRAAEPAV